MGCFQSRDTSMDHVPYTIGLHGVRVPNNIIIDSYDVEHGMLPDWEAMNRVSTLRYCMRQMTKKEYHKYYCEFKGGNWWLIRK